MAAVPPPTPPETPAPAPRRLRPGTILVLLVLGALALLAASAFLPRFWAQRIGNQANGSFTSGIGLGLFYGFAFTLVALLVLALGLRRARSSRARLLLLAIALVLWTPNLLTLGIMLGPGGAAHAGERILDVEAPGFRTSSVIGWGTAAAVLLAAGLLLRSRRRAREQAAALRTELDASARPPT